MEVYEQFQNRVISVNNVENVISANSATRMNVKLSQGTANSEAESNDSEAKNESDTKSDDSEAATCESEANNYDSE